ncbi:MAG: hypothetical protein LBF22_15340 [Deltaproteobacteria bacterium]|nr:hypothetical protein [Deltaproteobacteria bacterium]
MTKLKVLKPRTLIQKNSKLCLLSLIPEKCFIGMHNEDVLVLSGFDLFSHHLPESAPLLITTSAA